MGLYLNEPEKADIEWDEWVFQLDRGGLVCPHIQILITICDLENDGRVLEDVFDDQLLTILPQYNEDNDFYIY